MTSYFTHVGGERTSHSCKDTHEKETNTTQQSTNQLTTELKEPPHFIFCNIQHRFLRVASIHIYIFSMVQNEWRQELRFKTHHVISLFNSLRNDETFCRQWFSTSALVEIINAVFQLETEYIVLESQQFKQSMSLPNLGGMFVESLQMCTEGMVCRTSINYHNGKEEYGYCFPNPPKQRHQRSQRSNVKKHGKDSRHEAGMSRKQYQ